MGESRFCREGAFIRFNSGNPQNIIMSEDFREFTWTSVNLVRRH